MKPRVCRFTRRSCHHFSTISAHEMTENSSNTARTNLATGPALQMRSKTPEVKESAVANEAPLRLPRSYVARRGTVNVLAGLFAALREAAPCARALTEGPAAPYNERVSRRLAVLSAVVLRPL